MTKSDILSRHRTSYRKFADAIKDLSEEDYLYQQAGKKWDVGQHLDHINRAVSALAKGASMPKFLIKWKFGKANRPSKTFDQLVAKYAKGIADGFKATGDFIPDAIPYSNKQIHLDKLMKNIQKIEKKIMTYSESQLDEIVVGHPAMGILTMREMMYFNIHHVEDHHRQFIRNLGFRTT